MIAAERLTSKARAYEPSFDRKAGANPLEINRNLETLLGERLNVLLSKNIYRIKNNLIYGKHRDEPFINTIQRGIEYKRALDGEQRVDKKREEAELDGFSIIQEILCHPNTSVGTMAISVSPPGEEGSLYKHNFYDIFILKKEKEERYIEVRRYSSALSNEEYREKLELFYPKIYGKDVFPTDDYFLSHAVVISDGFLRNPDEVHTYLHKNHKHMKDEDFAQVLKICSPFIKSYIKALRENPRDINGHSLAFNAILNKADREADYLKTHKDNLHHIFVRTYDSLSLEREIDFLGRQSVRMVGTGCGSSGGFGKNTNGQGFIDSVLSNPFSISDFGSLDEESYSFDEPGPCKKCGREINCGPCGICKSCDNAIRASQRLAA